MDLIVIYPKPYSIYVRGTIAVVLVQNHTGFRVCMRILEGHIGVVWGLVLKLPRVYVRLY